MTYQTVQETRRLSTGIAELNGAIEGGIPRGSLVLVSGTAGSGKTTFCNHFLQAGLANGERTIYASLCESEMEFRKNFCRMGFEFYESNHNFTFLEFLTFSESAASQYFMELLKAIEKTKATRLVVDSISAIIQSFNDKSETRGILHNIFEKVVKGMGVTTLIITEMPVGQATLGTGIEEFVADGIIILSSIFDKSHGRYDRSLRIQKMRGTQITNEEFHYTIDPRGLRVFKKGKLTCPDKSSTERILTGIEGMD